MKYLILREGYNEYGSPVSVMKAIAHSIPEVADYFLDELGEVPKLSWSENAATTLTEAYVNLDRDEDYYYRVIEV